MNVFTQEEVLCLSSHNALGMYVVFVHLNFIPLPSHNGHKNLHSLCWRTRIKVRVVVTELFPWFRH